MGELTGKTAFVTGSGRGLGRVMAERLAELGANVAIHDLDRAQPAKYGEFKDIDEVAALIGRKGVRVAAVTGNIGDPEAVAKMKADIGAALGEVHILVNCAGGDIGAAGGKPVPNDALGISFEDIKVLTNNNLIGTMLVCQAFVPPMVAAGSGSVVNIASAAAHMGCSPEVVYSTLKAAVVHYTRCLAKELIESGRAGERGEPGADQDGAVPGDAEGRSGPDGQRQAVAQPLRGAGRDRRRGGVPRRAAGEVRQRSGHPGGRGVDAVSGVRRGMRVRLLERLGKTRLESGWKVAGIRLATF